MNTSIILPAYNEEKAIEKVIDDVREAMEKVPGEYEIIVVDDGSTDNTALLARKKEARVISRKIRGGSGAARKTGILAAKGEFIVMLDCDGTYTTADIPKMLDLLKDYDQVNGVRTSEEGALKFLRMSTKWMITKLAEYLTEQKIPDLNTGLKVFRRKIMLKFLWLIPDGFSCVTSMTLAFMCNGYSVKWIPTQYKKRIGSSKFHPVRDTYNYILTIIRIIMYFNPLKVFIPSSISLLLFGIIKTLYDFYFVVHKMQLSDIIIIMTAVIIFVLGLLADLIVAQGRRLNE